jgi:hypothetical protein
MGVFCRNGDRGFLSIPANPSSDPLTQVRNVEVNEQSNTLATQFEVGEQLCFVDRKDGLNRFHFDNHFVFDEQIDAVAELDDEAIVFDCKWFLRFEGDAEALQFVTQARSIRTFQQTRPEL